MTRTCVASLALVLASCGGGAVGSDDSDIRARIDDKPMAFAVHVDAGTSGNGGRLEHVVRVERTF